MSSILSEKTALKKLLIQLNENLIEIGQPIQLLRSIQPVNAADEKRKFLEAYEEGEQYNPHFEYEPPAFNLLGTRKQLALLKLDIAYREYGVPILPLISFENELKSTLKLIETRASPNFSKCAFKAYGTPNDDLVRKALLCTEKSPTQNHTSETTISAEMAKCRFEHKLASYEFHHWKVVLIDSAASRVTTSSSEKAIRILRTAHFSEQAVNRLLTHEIDTHVLRSENGSRQPYYKVFSAGLQNYIETEEGLATYNEYLTQNLDSETLRNYALRVLAVAWSQRYSFYETFCKIVKYEGKTKAYNLTLRVKRGLQDTSQPGGFTKDYLYFSGYEKLQAYHQSNADMSTLYVGKIGIDDLQYIPHLVALALVKPATYLPVHFANLKNY